MMKYWEKMPIQFLGIRLERKEIWHLKKSRMMLRVMSGKKNTINGIKGKPLLL